MGTEKGTLSADQNRCLTKCFGDIKRDLIMDSVAGDLMSANVLTIDEWEQLKKHPQETHRTEEFLFLLWRRPSSAYISFTDVLHKHGYNHLVEGLEKACTDKDFEHREQKMEEPVPGESLVHIQPHPQLNQQSKLPLTDDNKQMMKAMDEIRTDLGTLKREMKGEVKSEIKTEMKTQLQAIEGLMTTKFAQMMQTMAEKESTEMAYLKQHAREKDVLQKKIEELDKEIDGYKEKLKKKEKEMTQLFGDSAAKEYSKLKKKLKEREDQIETLKKQLEQANIDLAHIRPMPINAARKSSDDPVLPAHGMYKSTFRMPRDFQTKKQPKKK